jgi:hypothetical protein
MQLVERVAYWQVSVEHDEQHVAPVKLRQLPALLTVQEDGPVADWQVPPVKSVQLDEIAKE